MSEAVVVALITGACAVVAQLIIARSNQQKITSELDKRSELKDTELKGQIDVIRTEIAELRKATERHNQVIDRTYALEKEVARQGEQIKTLFNKA